MAKGRKPAIDGLARPQGVLDDIVRPIIQKGARKVQNIAGRHIAKAKGDKVVVAQGADLARRKVVRSAYNFEKKVAAKRSSSYWRKAYKANEKMHDALTKGAVGRATRQHKKSTVQLAKAHAAQNMQSSVRRAAKGARLRGGYR